MSPTLWCTIRMLDTPVRIRDRGEPVAELLTINRCEHPANTDTAVLATKEREPTRLALTSTKIGRIFRQPVPHDRVTKLPNIAAANTRACDSFRADQRSLKENLNGFGSPY